MSTEEDIGGVIPINILWDRVLLVTIFGVLDSQRAHMLMENMLAEVSRTEAKVIILDILGVVTVDTQVANHLIKVTHATRLMGCNCIVSGISPQIAETMVSLGVRLEDVATTATLKDAIDRGFRDIGLQITARKKSYDSQAK